MKIIERKIAELIPAEYNPRVLSDKRYQDIKQSLTEFGLVDPIIVNKNPDRKDIIVGGHQRSKVWADLGNETIPTVEVNLDFDREKELNIRLNKNTGEFDTKLLTEYFEHNNLLEWGFDLWDLKSEMDEVTSKGEKKVEIEKMEARVFEHHDFILIKFEESHDFLKAVNIFNLRKVDVSIVEAKKRMGLGRVLDSKVFFEKMKDYVENHIE